MNVYAFRNEEDMLVYASAFMLSGPGYAWVSTNITLHVFGFYIMANVGLLLLHIAQTA